MAIAATFWLNNFASFSRVPQICDTSSQDYFWRNPANSQKDDTSYSFLDATNVGPAQVQGNTPTLAGFGISNPVIIPDNATINGLILRINRGSYPVTPPLLTGIYSVQDNLIQLFNNNSTIGVNKSSSLEWGTAWRYDSFGGETDTWGVSGGLTPEIVKSSGFGISMGAYVDVNVFYDFRNYVAVDNFEVTIFYTEPSVSETIIIPRIVIPEERFNSLHQLNRIIKPRILKPEESAPLHTRKSSYNITQRILNPQEVNTPQQIRSNINLKPNFIRDEPVLSSNSLKTFSKITNRILTPAETLSPSNKFFNLFYDNLDEYSVWSAASDPTCFTWDGTLSLGGKSIRRLSTNTKFASISYPLRYDVSNSLYFSGFIYISGASNYAGLGFCIQNNLIDGYYAVIDTRNSTTTSARSFRLFKSSNNGATITQLSTFNQAGLIEQNKWYRIIIQVDSSGNMQANLYKDGNGSTLVSATGATLTYKDNSSPYTFGFYGVTAFTTAAFDNLTNIQARFIDTNVRGISSQESFAKPTIIPGPISISLINKGVSGESFGSQKLNNNIKPNNFNTFEILSNISRINANNKITNNILNPEEFVSRDFFVSRADIFTYQSFNFDGIEGTATLIPGPRTIQHSGVAARSAFSNTIIKTTNSISNLNIKNEEIFSNIHNISRNIKVSSALSSEVFGVNNLFTFYNIAAKSIVGDSISNNKLNLNIKNNILNSEELFNKQRLNSFNYIINKIIKPDEAFGSILIPGLNRINPRINQPQETFGNFTLTNIVRINQNILKPDENISNNSLNRFIIQNVLNINELFGSLEIKKEPYLIKPNSFSLQENSGLNTFRFTIVPNSLDTFETISKHNLNSLNILQPKILFSSDILEKNTLKTNSLIEHKSIHDIQFILRHQLSNLGNIQPRIFNSEEILSSNVLYSNANIKPSSINFTDIFGLHLFNRRISPNNIKNDENIGDNILKTFAYIYPPSGDLSEDSSITSLIMFDPDKQTIFLNSRFPTLPGYCPPIADGAIGNIETSVFAKISPETIDPEREPGNHALDYNKNIIINSLNIEEAFGSIRLSVSEKFIQPSSITLDEIGAHRLFSFWPISPKAIPTEENILLDKHKLYAFNNIYPLGIETEESRNLLKHFVRPTLFPGKIFSWIESIYTIESDLDFRKTS